jgi:hypothetical protein
MASMGNAQRGALGGLAKLGEGARTTSDLSRVGGGLSRGANEGKKLNAAPWSDTFPAAGATLDLDFANNRGFVRGVGQGGVMDAITFTRASTGWYVGEDGLLQEADNGEPRFDWASTEQVAQRNLLTFSEQFDDNKWSKATSSLTFGQMAPDSSSTAWALSPSSGTTFSIFQVLLNTTSTHSASIYVKDNGRGVCGVGMGRNTRGYLINLDLTDGTFISGRSVSGGVLDSYSIEDIGSGWYRVVVSAFTPSDGGLIVSGGDGISSTDGILIWHPQLELGNTATDYQAIAQATTSTPLRANPTSNGILIEEARTNRLLWNRDATQTQWVKTNITATKDQTGIDGVANAASSLTATDDNGTCIQTITLAAGNRTGSVYLKRLTGTGNIQVTLDGSTYSTVELSDTEWYRIVLSGSVTNPTVGIKIAVDGDAVAMDYGQFEDGLFATSPILTTTATATRAVDTTSISIENSSAAINSRNGAFRIDFKPFSNSSAGGIFRIGDTVNNITLYNTTAGRLGMNLRSRNNTYSDSNGLNNAIIANEKNVISASWSSRKLIRASNAGVSDERNGVFSPDIINNFQFATITANNSTNARIIYFAKEFTFDTVLELSK